MPIVPSSVQPISLDVPSYPDQSSGVGIISQALGSAGSKVAEAAGNVFVQLRHAEAESVVLDRFQKQTDQAKEWLEREKLKSKDGYAYSDDGSPIKNPDGSQKPLTDHYKDWSEKNFRDNQDSLPSPYAQDLYRKKMGEFYHGFRDDVWNNEMKIRLGYIGDLREDRIRRQGNKQVQAPNVQDLYRHLYEERKFLRDNQGVVYNPRQVHELDEKLLKVIPENLFQGFENEILSKKRLELEGQSTIGGTRPERIKTARNAIAVILGEDDESKDLKSRGMHTLSELMDPERKAHWLDRFNTLLEHASSHDTNDWVERGNRMFVSLMGSEKSPDGRPIINRQVMNDFYKEGVALKKADPKSISDINFIEKLVANSAMFNAAPVIGSWQFYMDSPDKQKAKIDSLLNESMKEMDALLKRDLPNRPFDLSIGSPIRARIRGMLEQRMESAQREAEKDFPLFTRNNPIVANTAKAISYEIGSLSSPAVRAAIRNNDQQIKNLWGMRTGSKDSAPPAYLSAPEAEKIGLVLNGNANSDQKTEYLLGLHRANPTTYNSKIHQLVTSGKLKPEWYVFLSIGDDKVFASEMVNAITNPIADPEPILAANSSTVGDLKKMIYDESKTYVDSLITKNPQSPISIREVEAVQRTLFNMAVKRVATEKVSPETAAKDVVGSLVNNRFLKVNASPSLFGNKILRPPKFVHGVEMSADDHKMLERNLGGYFNEASIKALNPDLPAKLDPRILPERFHEAVARTLKFRLNQTQDAYIPTWEDTYHQTRWDLTIKGKSIELPIMELRKYNEKNDPAYIKAGKAAKEAGEKLLDKTKKVPDATKEIIKKVHEMSPPEAPF